MSSPKTFIEDRLARRREIVQRIEMMRNHLAGKNENAVGSGRNYEDTTEQDIQLLEEEIAIIDAQVEKMRNGNA